MSAALAAYVTFAERYIFDDANASLFKLRQFAELLARLASARCGFDPTGMPFVDVVAMLRRQNIISRQIRDLFDQLRLLGNEAAHEGTADRVVALRALVTARELAIWYFRTYVDITLQPGPFRPPPNPSAIQQELQRELDDLRLVAARTLQDLEEARGEIRKLEDIKLEVERDSRAQQQKLISEVLKASLEQQLAERAAYEARITQLAKDNSAQTAESLISFVKRSRIAAQIIGHRDEDARQVPLAQVRIRGPGQSGCHNAPFVLVQSTKGGMVTKNCTRCNFPYSLSSFEFAALDIWVSCPKCRIRMTQTRIRGNYGYSCTVCDWRCLLASLLPHFSEVAPIE